MKHIARFYLNTELRNGAIVTVIPSQMQHATAVLRLKIGDNVRIFNETFGEWNCRIYDIQKHSMVCTDLFREPQNEKNGVVIAFSLINSNRISILLEKITELGVSEIIPIISQYTQHRKFSVEKAKNIIIGACEQSGRMSIPKIHDIISLDMFLKNYPYDKKLIVADEEYSGNMEDRSFPKDSSIFLIGPEGGFSNMERELFAKYKFVRQISLGKNILRSETAAIVCAASVIHRI